MKTNTLKNGVVVLELSRRNLETLLEKLDDPFSAKTLISPERDVIVTAVENEEHYSDREPGPMWTNGEWK
jgi:hypothetical protein